MEDLSRQLQELIDYINIADLDEEVKQELIKKSNDLQKNIITSLKQNKLLEKELIESKYKSSFYEASLDALPNPIFIKNKTGEFVYFNPKYSKYFGMEREDYLNKSVLDLDFLPISDRVRYQEEDLKLISTGETLHYEISFELPGGEKGDSLYWSKGFQVNSTDEKGLVGEIVDISIQKKLRNEINENVAQLEVANEKIKKMMREDYLTGLYNRRVVDDISKKIDSDFQHQNINITVLMADLDHFKDVNDTFGHTVGDGVIKKFADILKACTRKKDMVIRYGGEEFLVILTDTKKEKGIAIAERIRCMTEDRLLLPGGDTKTVSIGIAQLEVSESFSDCIDRADVALYSAKQQGRNQIVD